MPAASASRLILAPSADRSLEVEFRRLGDRYAHAIYLSRGGERLLLAESVEGGGQANWPASPALQQFSLQSLGPGREAAFLVGMAGKSHFSLSVSTDEPLRRVVFDVACNYREPPLWLGSTYRLANRTESRRDARFSAHEGFATVMIESDSAELRFSPPAQAPVQPASGRWCYWIDLL